MRPDRRRTEAIVLGALAAGALAGAFASLGRLSWWLELFTHFQLQYAVWLAGCCIALLWLRRPGLALAAVALAAVNATPLLYYYAVDPIRPPVAAPEYKAVLLNVFFLNSRRERVLAYVRDAEPDLAIFLEATAEWVDELRSLEDVLPFQARVGEMFVTSRRPLVGLRGLRLAARDAAGVTFATETDGQLLTVIGAHVDWPLGPRISAARNAQLDALAALARSADGPLLVLADLNTTAFSPVFRNLLVRGGLSDCAAGRGLHATWPALLPPLYLQIDHCLHGPGLDITQLATGPFVGSDHYPLEVTVHWPPARAPGRPDLRAARGPRTSRR